MSSQHPSMADMIERLREIYSAQLGSERISDERLSALIDVRLSTLNRWKRADTEWWGDALRLLGQVGWLSIPEGDLEDAESFPGRPPSLEAVAAQLLLGQAEGLEYLKRIDEALQRAPEERTQAAPKKKAASRGTRQ